MGRVSESYLDLGANYLQLWYQALSSPFGIELISSDPEQAKKRLYEARSNARDEDLKKISIVASPFDASRLWLVKRKQDDSPP